MHGRMTVSMIPEAHDRPTLKVQRMRIPRIHTDQPLEPDSQARLDERSAHYLARVLRMRPGDPLVVFNGDGFDYAAEVLDPRCRDLAVSARVPAAPESPLHITLVQAVGKGDRMDYSLQKATELGVTALRPVFTERTEVRLEGRRLEKRERHWRGVLAAACEQCGRGRIPELLPAIGLSDWLLEASAARRLALVPGADHTLVSQAAGGEGVELLIGPEGGISDAETRQLKLAGVKRVSLGPRVLRTETAGPAAIAVLQALLGDFA